MGVIDKFLNTVKLNDDDYDYDEIDGYYDDEYEEDDFDEERPKKRIFSRRSEEETDFDELPEPEPAREEKASAAPRATRQKPVRTTAKVSPMRARRTGGMEVCVIRPKDMNDTREITETLLEGCTVILNLGGIENKLAQRVIDFAAGSCFAVHGNLQKVNDDIFIITPSGVDISGDIMEMANDSYDVQAYGNAF